MPTQEHINEIAEYLRKFKSGELEHYQQWYHCGTAHCLAGWKAVHDAQATGVDVFSCTKKMPDILYDDLNWISLPLLNDFMRHTSLCCDEWQYAQLKWGLNGGEAQMLFDADLSLEDMIDNLQSIDAHNDLTCPSI